MVELKIMDRELATLILALGIGLFGNIGASYFIGWANANSVWFWIPQAIFYMFIVLLFLLFVLLIHSMVRKMAQKN